MQHKLLEHQIFPNSLRITTVLRRQGPEKLSLNTRMLSFSVSKADSMLGSEGHTNVEMLTGSSKQRIILWW